MGPTASGKTGVAVDLVQRLSCEIISVDSAMVYRGMDIELIFSGFRAAGC